MIDFLALQENLSTMQGMKEHLKSAIKTAGGFKPFSEAVGAPSVHAVRGWLLTRVPADYCPSIERVTGVRCEDLRPDVEWDVLRSKPQHEEPQAA